VAGGACISEAGCPVAPGVDAAHQTRVAVTRTNVAADGQATAVITAYTFDKDGHPVAGTVYLSTVAVSLNLAQRSITTDVTGVGTMTATSTRAGAYTVHAWADATHAAELSAHGSPLTVTFVAGTVCMSPCVPDPEVSDSHRTRLEVIADGQKAGSGQDKVAVYAFDKYGNPVPNATVGSWEQGSAGLTAQAPIARTDASGRSVVVYTAAVAGTYQAVVQLNGTDIVWVPQSGGDPAEKSSPVTLMFVLPEAPSEPVVEKANAAEVSGTADPGVKIVVADADGKTLGETTADESGHWSVKTPPGTRSGKITVTATDAAGQTAETTADLDTEVSPPKVVKANTEEVSGTADPWSVIVVKDASGQVLGETTADRHGDWSVEPPKGTTPGKITVTATDEAGNSASVTADLLGKPVVKVANADEITGTAPPGTKVVVTDADGKKLGETTADENGDWSVKTPPETRSGKIIVTATDETGNSASATADLDTDPPSAPKIIKANAEEISGTSDPGTTVVVKDASGKVLGETTADENGHWSVKTPAGTGSGKITVTATDGAGNSVTVTGSLDTTPPAPPVVKRADGEEISGTGEPGTKIVVTDADGKTLGETEVDKDGNWSVKTPAGAASGPITVTSTDPAGNSSSVTTKLAVTVSAPTGGTAGSGSPVWLLTGAIVAGTGYIIRRHHVI
jgi:hypothetical protein